MKKLLCLLILLSVGNIVSACVTGYACSLHKDKNTAPASSERSLVNQKNQELNDNILENNSHDDLKHEFFVNGGKYNSPAYTEMFTFRGGLLSP